MTQKTTITRITVHDAADSPVFGDSAIHVEIDDEAGGPFLALRSCGDIDTTRGRISVDFEQWELVSDAAKQLMAQFDGEQS